MNERFNADYYEHSYSTPGERYFECYARGLPLWAKMMNQYHVDYVVALLGLDHRSDRVLDLGSGMGYYVKAWKNRAFDVVGVEIAAEAVKRSGMPEIRQGDIRDLPKFVPDIALAASFAVLEHIPLNDCEAVMKGIRNNARASAHVIGHDVGGDPSHINVMDVRAWSRWFADQFRPWGWSTLTIANPLVPTMPVFLQVKHMPAHLSHSVNTYGQTC